MFISIRQGLNHVYNFEFQEAQPFFLEIKKKYPTHPAFPFSQALILFTKNFPMIPSHPEYKQFAHYVSDCLVKAEGLLEKDPKNEDGIFYALTAHSYQALMHSFSKEYFQAISDARKVYVYIKKGFELKKTYPDFYYTSGLFYYYAEQYPKTHPMVKPLMFFFQDGNKHLGINDLNIAYLKGIYTKQEAAILLAYVTIKYDAKPAQSLEYSEKFYFSYPNNPFALARYIEGLLFVKNYKKAKELLPKLQNTTVPYFKMVSEVFAGWLQEHLYLKAENAKNHYLNALRMCDNLPNKTDDYKAFSYLGLGRICDNINQKKQAQSYFKKVLDIAEYEAVKEEAKTRLKENP